MSNVSAVVKDGKIVDTTSKSSTTSTDSSSTLKEQKDQFMTLLVAQMKYQDPLEPTSNTEYISQYATFTEVEQMQNMAESMTLSRASDLVGKTVVVNTEDSNGNTVQIQGSVDYVTYSNGSAFVNIGGVSYDADNVASVIDTEYEDAINSASSFLTKLEALGDLDKITLSDKDTINELYSTYNAMNDKTKSYISSTASTTLQQYYDKIKSLQDEDKDT